MVKDVRIIVLSNVVSAVIAGEIVCVVRDEGHYIWADVGYEGVCSTMVQVTRSLLTQGL